MNDSKKLPAMFDCGCSHLKVSAGRCDIYNERGELRATVAGEGMPRGDGITIVGTLIPRTAENPEGKL